MSITTPGKWTKLILRPHFWMEILKRQSIWSLQSDRISQTTGDFDSTKLYMAWSNHLNVTTNHWTNGSKIKASKQQTMILAYTIVQSTTTPSSFRFMWMINWLQATIDLISMITNNNWILHLECSNSEAASYISGFTITRDRSTRC